MLDFSLIKPYQFLIIAVHLLFLKCSRWLLLTRNNSCVEDWRKFVQEKCVNSWLARYVVTRTHSTFKLLLCFSLELCWWKPHDCCLQCNTRHLVISAPFPVTTVGFFPLLCWFPSSHLVRLGDS